jgi:cell division GTPase FtsZ
MAICSYPFQFEGRRRDFAESMTIAFKETDNFLFFYMNSVIGKCGNVSLLEAFHRANVEVYRILKTTV